MRCSDGGRDERGEWDDCAGAPVTATQARAAPDAVPDVRATTASAAAAATTTRLRQAINHPLPATTRAREVAWNPTGLRTQVRGFKSPRARQNIRKFFYYKILERFKQLTFNHFFSALVVQHPPQPLTLEFPLLLYFGILE